MSTKGYIITQLLLSALSIILLGYSSALIAQIRTAEQPPDVDKIVKKVAAKESEFQEARNFYTFRQEVRIQTLGFSNQTTGEFYRVSDVLFDDKGSRYERIIKFPPSTLKGLEISPTDLRDIAEIQPFSINTKDLPKYNLSYIGKEKIDEIDTYVFEVRPKIIPKYKRGGERVFSGRIWIDDRDLQIVKTFGKGLPEGEDELFPRFETYRENIDGKYWFPTYTFADDTLEFKTGAIHMRMEIRYTNYKRFASDVDIKIEGEDAEESAPKPKTKKD